MEECIVYNNEHMIATLVNDIKHFDSTYYKGAGVIKVFLQPGASVDAGIAQITGRGQTVLRWLPPASTPSFIRRYNAASVPIPQVQPGKQEVPPSKNFRPIFFNTLFLKSSKRIELLGLILVLALMIWRLMERTMRMNRKLQDNGVDETTNLATDFVHDNNEVRGGLCPHRGQNEKTLQASGLAPAQLRSHP